MAGKRKLENKENESKNKKLKVEETVKIEEEVSQPVKKKGRPKKIISQ